MPELVVLVIDDPNKADEIVQAWVAVGVGGVTLVNSAGLSYFFSQRGARDDLPIMPSLSSLLRGREETHRTLFTVVPDGFAVEALANATEKITGNLDDPNTGILFVVPVRQAWGLHQRRAGKLPGR